MYYLKNAIQTEGHNGNKISITPYQRPIFWGGTEVQEFEAIEWLNDVTTTGYGKRFVHNPTKSNVLEAFGL